MIGLESIKDMHMIHCVCPNRTQQWLTAMYLLFSASSEGRIRNLGLGSKIGTFLGPFWHFGPIWDQVPNLGPFWSACIFHPPLHIPQSGLQLVHQVFQTNLWWKLCLCISPREDEDKVEEENCEQHFLPLQATHWVQIREYECFGTAGKSCGSGMDILECGYFDTMFLSIPVNCQDCFKICSASKNEGDLFDVCCQCSLITNHS